MRVLLQQLRPMIFAEDGFIPCSQWVACRSHYSDCIFKAKWATCSRDAVLQEPVCSCRDGVLPAPCMTSSQPHERVHASDDGLAGGLCSILQH